MKQFCVYILTNKPDGTLYTGVTSNLQNRIWEHKSKIAEGFSKKYNLDKLIYFELHDDAQQAIKREKRIKKYNRQWKIDLIEKTNPNWNDLYGDLF